jgi:hypothetical protein
MSTIHRRSGVPDEDRPAAGRVLGGFEQRLLHELLITVAERNAAGDDPLSHPALPQGATGRTGARPRSLRTRWLLLPAASAVVAAGVAIALLATSGSPSGRGAGPGSGQRAVSFGPGTTVAGVLRNAALAALRLPDSAPQPDQFVYVQQYSKTTKGDADGLGTGLFQNWLSVDGSRIGLWRESAAGSPPYSLDQRTIACANGKEIGPGVLKNFSCTPQPAYFPDMPTSPAALRGYLMKQFDPGDSGHFAQTTGVLDDALDLLAGGYLSPAQQAALYELLAQTPGLTLVPTVTDVTGQTGVGIRGQMDKGMINTVIFSRGTYRFLGENTIGLIGPVKGWSDGWVLQNVAIVDHPGQLP